MGILRGKGSRFRSRFWDFNLARRASGQCTRLLLVNARVLERKLDAGRHAEAVRPGVCHVVRVAVGGATQVLADDGSSACLCVLKRLHAEHTRALTHHEPVAVLIPRPGRHLRVCVPRGERPGGGREA